MNITREREAKQNIYLKKKKRIYFQCHLFSIPGIGQPFVHNWTRKKKFEIIKGTNHFHHETQKSGKNSWKVVALPDSLSHRHWFAHKRWNSIEKKRKISLFFFSCVCWLQAFNVLARSRADGWTLSFLFTKAWWGSTDPWLKTLFQQHTHTRKEGKSSTHRSILSPFFFLKSSPSICEMADTTHERQRGICLSNWKFVF